MFAHSAARHRRGRDGVGGVRAAAVGEAEPQRRRHRRHRRRRARRRRRGARAREHRARHGHRRRSAAPTGSVRARRAAVCRDRPSGPWRCAPCTTVGPRSPTPASSVSGGVSRGVDAVEMMLAGADAVEVGTATFRDPRAPARVLAGLQRWCRLHDVGDVRDLVGAVQRAPSAIDRRRPSSPAMTPLHRPAPPPPPPLRPHRRRPGRPRPGPVTRPDGRPPASPAPPPRRPGHAPGGDRG